MLILVTIEAILCFDVQCFRIDALKRAASHAKYVTSSK